MRLAVVGSRYFTDYALMSREISKLSPSVIISGGATGADTLAEKYATENEIEFVCFPPDKELIKSNGFAFAAKDRNKKIVEHSDMVIAFPTKKSRGTWHTVNVARKHNKPVIIIGQGKEIE